MKKICIITGSRAEWGLLRRLAAMVKSHERMELQIIATNMHLSPEFGLTYKEIERDGFRIDRQVEMLLSGDSPAATSKSTGLATIGFADAYRDLEPDLIIILGDRYEMLSAATAALIFRIPIAHLHGGEITEGAYDDAIRHAITKMSHLHFTSTEEHKGRVVQMGEQPGRVFNVGAIGIDNIRHTSLMSKEEIEHSLNGFRLDRNTILVTFHPVTMQQNTAEGQTNELLYALDSLPEARVIFTMPNSDTEGRVIMTLIKEWCERNTDRAVWFNSLGSRRYLSALQYVGAVVGNSSSAIIEVPSFGIPSLNIGDRQKGRTRAMSVVDCTPIREDIVKNLRAIIGREPIQVENPYEKPNTAQRIIDTIAKVDWEKLTDKKFYDRD